MTPARYLGLTLAAGLLSSTAALAQTAMQAAPSPTSSPTRTTDQPTAAGVGEIIVTAQKRSERLSDVPLSITAASADALNRRGVKSVGDLEKIVPGLTFTQTAYGAPIYTIRGIGFFDEAVGISPTVSVYVDQVPIPFSRATEGATLDLERVEVLKGPQGTLFGQNSTGGAINYIAAKPTSVPKAGFDLSYGRFNDADIDGFVSGPLTSTLNARLSARTEQSGDWQYSTSRNAKLGQKNFFTGRLLLDWHPDEKIKFELNANGWKDRSDAQAVQFERYDATVVGPTAYAGSLQTPDIAGQLTARPPAPQNARAADWDAGRDYRRNDSFYQISLRGDWQMTDRIALTAISAYSKLKVYNPADIDGTNLPLFFITVDASTKTFSQELRLSGTAGNRDKIRWMVGGNYQHDRVSDNQLAEDQGSNSGVGPFRFFKFTNDAGDQHITTKAAFGSLDYKLADTLTLQGSARYTSLDHSLAGCLRDGDGGLATAFGFLSTLLNGNPHVPAPGDPSYIPPGGCATLNPITNLPTTVHNDLREHNVSWRASLNWKPTVNTLVYLNVTRGYKSGSFGTVPAIRPAQLDPIAQEQVTAYETGIKTSLLDRHIDLAAAGFYYDYRNKQLLGYINDAFFGGLPGLISIPKSRVLGAELSITAHPFHGISLSAAGTYISPRVISHFDTQGPLASSGVADVKGEGFPNTPKWNLVGDAEYRFPISATWGAYVGGDITYHSKATATFDAPPEFDITSYALLGARAGLEKEDGSLRVQVWGRNITNKYYWSNVDHVIDAIVRVAGMPASYGVTVSTRF